jgi:hypothetical protein
MGAKYATWTRTTLKQTTINGVFLLKDANFNTRNTFQNDALVVEIRLRANGCY